MSELKFIERVLREAGAYVRAAYADKAAATVSCKADPADLLTETDLEVQRRVAAALEERYPQDLLVAEEGDAQRFPEDRRRRCWVLDPIDGTHNFVRGLLPSFGVSLAFVAGGEVLAGGVMFPVLGELFLAERGEGARRNGERVCTSEVVDLAAAKVEMDFGRPYARARSMAMAGRVLGHVGQVRCHGSAVVSLCEVAAGEAEAFMHVGLNPWDYAAGLLLIREAGGIVTRLDGTAVDLFDGRKGLLAASGALHGRLLELVGGSD